MSDTRPTVAFLGTGLMGAAMVLRLLEQGFEVTVWNRTADKLGPLVASGARAADTPAEAALEAAIVMACVYDAAAVEDCVFGPGGVAEAAGPAKVFVDHSTIHPDASVALAARLRDSTGMGWVDAPVSGGPEGARSGQMAIMAGGTEADIDRVGPVMAALGRTFTHVGPPGAGQACKCVNQVLVGVGYVLMAEAVHLAETMGLEASRVPAALDGGHADSRMLQIMFPRMVARAFDPPSSFAQQMLKDMDTIEAMARQRGLQLAVFERATQRFRDYCAAGHGPTETASILRLYTGET